MRSLRMAQIIQVIQKEQIMKKIILIILVCIGISISCTPKPKRISKQEKLQLLNQELNNWQSFKITGIIDAEYQAYSLRNNIILLKNEDKFRADVLGSGLFGLGGGIFMALYIDKEMIQIKEPNKPIEDYELDDNALDWLKYITEDLFIDLESKKDEITDKHKAEIEGFEIKFLSNMKISEIINKESNVKISFGYNRQNNLEEINVVSPNIRKLIIHIDKIEYNKMNILPLRNSS